MENIFINKERLMANLERFSRIGALSGGGVCRLALTTEDKTARDTLKEWMLNLGLDIKVDKIGNMFGTRKGKQDLSPVMIGSHLDTVGTGGCYDGSLGVLAAMEAVETLNDKKIETKKSITVVNFTNEEGVRFIPDMMGSLVVSGGMSLDEIYRAQSVDGSVNLYDELKRIGYEGKEPVDNLKADSYIELHIEQGPVLEHENIKIAAVEMVQGISWTEIIIHGQANHAGTTPMELRKDAGFAASAIVQFARKLTKEVGGRQVANAGMLEVYPNLINVVPERVRLTLDLRNTDNSQLILAENKLEKFIKELEVKEKVTIESKRLVRFNPVDFDEQIISLIDQTAGELDYSSKRMHSGAGHDAQMMAAVCPTAMIFIPSQDGISHNVNEYSSPEDIEAGANVLLNAALKRAGRV